MVVEAKSTSHQGSVAAKRAKLAGLLGGHPPTPSSLPPPPPLERLDDDWFDLPLTPKSSP